MKSLDTTPCVELLSAMLADASVACRTSLDRDLMTIRSRVEHEGLSFLTITLPTFDKTFEQCLEQGWIDSTLFAGFKSAHKGSFPAFLQGLTSLVFNLDGVIKDAPNPDAVEAIRQICLCFNKIKLECTPSRLRKAEEQFVATEREVSRFRVGKYSDFKHFAYVTSILYGHIFDIISEKIRSLDILPRHGPGSTEDRTIGNQKFIDRRTTGRLQRLFPIDWYKFFNLGEFADCLSDPSQLEQLRFIPRKDEPPVRVVFVPKTMKTPRVIAIEPVWNQFFQQGLMREFVHLLETDKVTGGQINFSRQSINRNLAFESSLSRANATIDLSEASDRVHPALVAGMMRYRMTLSRAIFSCRSERAMLPSGKVLSLSKFASQGSALCFPVEAMVFYGIIVTALIKHRMLRLNRASIQTVAREVFVYGDDIVVPTPEVQVACEALEAAGLKVNYKKSFSSGFFRESCGMDAFMGVNVTPIYIRHPVPTSKRDASEVESAISTANLFYKKGYWKTAQTLRNYVESAIGVVPHVLETSPVSGWFSFRGRQDHTKWDSDLHRLLVRGPKLTCKKYADPLDGFNALHKWVISRTGRTAVLGTPNPLERDSFMRSVARGKLRLNFRWSPAN